MNDSLFDISGKTILVTGAFGGLGLHFAEFLAQRGARVAMAGRRIEAGRNEAARLRTDGFAAEAFELDLTRDGEIDLALAAAETVFGPIDVLINNAGVTKTRPLLEVSRDEWASVVDVNLSGAWYAAQAVARRMVQHGRGGSIVNIASILGRRVAQQVPAYAASKAALLHLTEAMALELARHDIRVNAIEPCYIETDMNRSFLRTDAGNALCKRIPQRRFGAPGSLDGALLLLASDASSFMTGASIVVDGGHSINSL
ncbi:NAD(P)-dependent dehydrogenase (short-subunit alcohol dehydrogenase family) [Paraburkholderia unamae]|uniref:SDR family NAD(P)-dependent oxidoreductase n=1 Tax=Paraburkholderia unamae TaxID=219649 RepID=UPI000DC4EA2E|nr:glucose 1-dehydrogenase [Paraburkholderia unamae]RAR57960.1 NAD(P)-dependent dehydrogenase (short-subunit alcohol dehydrogenase family) [Paraburkholderia unamae]